MRKHFHVLAYSPSRGAPGEEPAVRSRCSLWEVASYVLKLSNLPCRMAVGRELG